MRSSRRRRARRRGSVLAMMPWVLVICVAMLAFMVDLGYVFAAKSHAQNVADAASLAGAMQLRVKRGGPKRVREMAIRFADLNLPDTPGVVRPADVQMGIWEPRSRIFVPFPGFGRCNAVRVTVRHDGQTSSGIGLFFARLFGQSEAAVSAEAIAAYDRSNRGMPRRAIPVLVR